MARVSKTALGIAVSAFVALFALVALPGTASAQYQGGATLTLDKTTVQVGESVTATATGLKPGSSATFTFESTPVNLGTVTVDGAGVATITFNTPNVTLGGHLVRVVGTSPQDQAVNLTANITVVGAGGTGSGVGGTGTGTGTAGGGTLPRTGSDATSTILPIALGLITLGGLAVVLTRRRADAAA